MGKGCSFCRVITREELYLIDSGAQFKVFSLTSLLKGVNLKRGKLLYYLVVCQDGTTDVTRTIHFGTPSQHEKECFTRVLKGMCFPSSL